MNESESEPKAQFDLSAAQAADSKLSDGGIVRVEPGYVLFTHQAWRLNRLRSPQIFN